VDCVGDEVNLLIVHNGPDIAGAGISLKRAFDACAPGWNARAIRRKDNWLRYLGDITWEKGTENPEAVELYRNADIVHIFEKPNAIDLFPLPHDKPVVVSHTGSRYRNDPDGISAQCQAIGATELAGSVDLMLRPNLGFLPLVADLDALARLRTREYRASGPVRIAHAPTNRDIKSTTAIIAAVNRLKRRYNVELDIIERVPWAECLRRKARADIFVDETTLGYGANAIECWAMGIPVVSGIANPEHRAMMLDKFGELPFVETDEAGLYATIELLVSSESQRQEAKWRGADHVDRWHSQEVVVDMATAIYDKAGFAVAA
jgi:hypothetical protein